MDATAGWEGRLHGCRHDDARWARERLRVIAERARRGQPVDRILAEVETRVAGSAALVTARGETPLRLDYPDLPVAARRDEILASLRRHPVLVLTGETGSGKTTQLPKMLLELGYGRRGRIVVTQPRRLAAVSVAARLREELDCPDPVVAHAVRFDDRADERTLISVSTDGLLLAQASRDPDLLAFDAVVVDEAHERSLNIDLLLGLLHRLRARRPDLPIVISSATIEAERFAAFFAATSAACPVIQVEGRMFPVEVRYAPPVDDDAGYLDAALNAIRTIHAGDLPGVPAMAPSPLPVPQAPLPSRNGDILCFLPTERDILEASRKLDDLGGATVLPLFGRLTPQEQQRIFAPARGRKIVLATNVAETSLTVPGIVFVVDAGLARLKRYQPSTRTERLPVEAVSRANCVQRAGRAGRIQAGVCVRLYPEEDFLAREPVPTPEILRSNLAGVLLTVIGMGLGDPQAFPWLDAPSPHAWDQARALLDELGALAPATAVTQADTLTPIGRTLAQLPCDPQVGRILVAGLVEGVAHEACTIAAFLSIQDPRVRPLGQEAKADAAHKALAHEAGDLTTVLRLWDRWEEAATNSKRARLCEQLYLGHRRMREWADVRHQLWSTLREGHRGNLPAHGSAAESWPIERIHRCVLAGMLGNVLLWDPTEKSYRAAGDRRLWVHPGSAMRAGKDDDGKKAPPPAPWLVACEVVETSRLFARLCAPIDPEWVVQLAGDRLKRRHRDPHYHPGRKQVVCTETTLWKGLPVRDGRLVPYGPIDREQAARVFIDQALAADECPAGLPEVVRRNHDLLAAAVDLRHRCRDGSLTVDRSHLAAFWRERLGDTRPAAVVELAAWLAEGDHGERARLHLRDLVDPALADRAAADYPPSLRIGGRDLPLRYRFSPGDADDGATLDLDEECARWITPELLDAAVPGWLDERVHAFLQQLPKDERRQLIPLAEHARALAEEIRPLLGRARVADLLSERLQIRRIRAPRFDETALPAWLRLRLRVVTGDGAITDHGRDHGAFFGQVGTASDRLRPLRAEWDTAPGDGWPGNCPAEVRLGGIVGHPGLGRDRDRGGRVAVRRCVYGSPAARDAWHEDGIDALLEASQQVRIDEAVKAVPGHIADRCQRTLGLSGGGIARTWAIARLRAVRMSVVPRLTDQAAWEDLAPRLAECRLTVDPAFLSGVCDRVDRLRTALKQGAKTLIGAGVIQGVAEDVARLANAPGWSRLPAAGLERLDRWLDAAQVRLTAAQRGDATAKKAHERSRHLLGIAADAVADANRLAVALGLLPRVRELWHLTEDCLSLAMQGGAGAAEGRLLHLAREIGDTLGRERDRIAATRTVLMEHRGYLARIADKARRERLSQELDEQLRSFPDLTLGADLATQHLAAAELAKRVRAAV